MITGEYSAAEYRIFSDGKEIYHGGNTPYDSQARVAAPDGVGLWAMRSFCIRTAKEFAEERHEKFAGIQRAETEEE